MAMRNSFDLLGEDDSEDPSQLTAAQVAAPSQPAARARQVKPAKPAQTVSVREAKGESGGGGGGRERERGSGGGGGGRGGGCGHGGGRGEVGFNQDNANSEKTGVGGGGGQGALEDRESRKPSENLTLEEYENVQKEKRKGLPALKIEERRVDVDEEFKTMLQLSSKKGNDDIRTKRGLGSDKGKRKVDAEKEEKAKKTISIDEFLKPTQGESYSGPGGSWPQPGRCAADWYSGANVISNRAAHSIDDPRQFPNLSAASIEVQVPKHFPVVPPIEVQVSEHFPNLAAPSIKEPGHIPTLIPIEDAGQFPTSIAN